MENSNLTLFTDLYQLTMMYGYYQSGKMDEEVAFDLFFRKNPFNNGYTIAAGLENLIDYINNLNFSHEDIDYLKETSLFPDDNFYKELRNFRFTGEIYAVEEGSVVFPNEPIVRVKTRLFEAQLIETAILSMVGHQTLIATKANRIVKAANGKPVIEMGARRGQGPESSTYGARAAYIGGVVGTSNVKAGKLYNIPISGTQAHSWVMSFNSELEAFKAYAKYYPDNLILLVDTYDVIKSGVPHAIQVFKEVHEQLGREPKTFGIRLDSGDLTYLSQKARQLLDKAGFPNAIIVASNDLDEYTIRELNTQGARIDSFGVGTKLITAFDQPALGSVYKLAAERIDGKWIPRIKRSENAEKVTNPGIKKIVRFFNEENEAIVDLIMLDDETLPDQPFEVFDPIYTWKRKTVDGASSLELLKPIFIDGQLVYDLPSLENIAKKTEENLKTFSSFHTRFSNPHEYHVDLSQNLWNVKMELLSKFTS